MPTAVIIARFQTPFLHAGHRYLIDQVKAMHSKVVIVLGVSPVKGSRRNPYDFYTRERMLKKAYPELFVLPLADHASDAAWSVNLDALLQSCFPDESFLLYGSRDSFVPAYSGKLPVKELAEKSDASATALRFEHADNVLDSDDFRLGINYAHHHLRSVVYPTVDIAVFKEGRTQLLLGRKAGRQEWRLPGGFADVSDNDFEAAARRELGEECGGIETGPLQYIGSTRIDDWRYRHEEDKIMTLLFATDLLYGHPEASDDLEQVAWFTVSDLPQMIKERTVAKEHTVLLELLLEKAILTTDTRILTQKN